MLSNSIRSRKNRKPIFFQNVVLFEITKAIKESLCFWSLVVLAVTWHSCSRSLSI